MTNKEAIKSFKAENRVLRRGIKTVNEFCNGCGTQWMKENLERNKLAILALEEKANENSKGNV